MDSVAGPKLGLMWERRGVGGAALSGWGFGAIVAHTQGLGGTMGQSLVRACFPEKVSVGGAAEAGTLHSVESPGGGHTHARV